MDDEDKLVMDSNILWVFYTWHGGSPMYIPVYLDCMVGENFNIFVFWRYMAEGRRGEILSLSSLFSSFEYYRDVKKCIVENKIWVIFFSRYPVILNYFYHTMFSSFKNKNFFYFTSNVTISDIVWSEENEGLCTSLFKWGHI